MAKPGGARCNLDCTYCFYLEKEKLYAATAARAEMTPEVLESYIRQMIDAHPVEAAFAWQGGEPTLLGVDFFRRAVALQRKHAGGKRISNAIQTNGVLLDDEWGRFLHQEGFLVGLSIDGPQHLHDAYRPDKGGRPTFTKVMRGMEVLNRHKVEFNTLTVVHRDNADHALEIYDFLVAAGSRFLQFIPLVERFAEQPSQEGLTRTAGPGAAVVSQRSVQPDQWGAFLCDIFDRWVRNDVGRVYVQLFEVTAESYMGLPQSLCLFRPTCGDAVALEHTGELYSCDHYVYPENRLGHIMETPLASLVEGAKQREFGRHKMDSLPAYCRRCDVRGACHGECPKNRFLETPDGEPGLNYLCRGYKRFFRQAAPFMQFLAMALREGRPARELMSFARAWDQRATEMAARGNLPGP
jgi:uncharacterized protein